MQADRQFKEQIMRPKDSIRNPPAFQEYAADMLANRLFRTMSLQERGLLMTMRFECWVNKSVPADAGDLAKTLGLPKEDVFHTLTSRVSYFFVETDKNLVCIELDAYRNKLLNSRQAMSEGGRKGGLNTLARHKNNEASLEGTLKPLSRDEFRRDEKNKSESLERENTENEERKNWINELDKYS